METRTLTTHLNGTSTNIRAIRVDEFPYFIDQILLRHKQLYGLRIDILDVICLINLKKARILRQSGKVWDQLVHEDAIWIVTSTEWNKYKNEVLLNEEALYRYGKRFVYSHPSGFNRQKLVDFIDTFFIDLKPIDVSKKMLSPKKQVSVSPEKNQHSFTEKKSPLRIKSTHLNFEFTPSPQSYDSVVRNIQHLRVNLEKNSKDDVRLDDVRTKPSNKINGKRRAKKLEQPRQLHGIVFEGANRKKMSGLTENKKSHQPKNKDELYGKAHSTNGLDIPHILRAISELLGSMPSNQNWNSDKVNPSAAVTDHEPPSNELKSDQKGELHNESKGLISDGCQTTSPSTRIDAIFEPIEPLVEPVRNLSPFLDNSSRSNDFSIGAFERRSHVGEEISEILCSSGLIGPLHNTVDRLDGSTSLSCDIPDGMDRFLSNSALRVGRQRSNTIGSSFITRSRSNSKSRDRERRFEEEFQLTTASKSFVYQEEDLDDNTDFSDPDVGLMDSESIVGEKTLWMDAAPSSTRLGDPYPLQAEMPIDEELPDGRMDGVTEDAEVLTMHPDPISRPFPPNVSVDEPPVTSKLDQQLAVEDSDSKSIDELEPIPAEIISADLALSLLPVPVGEKGSSHEQATDESRGDAVDGEESQSESPDHRRGYHSFEAKTERFLMELKLQKQAEELEEAVRNKAALEVRLEETRYLLQVFAGLSKGSMHLSSKSFDNLNTHPINFVGDIDALESSLSDLLVENLKNEPVRSVEDHCVKNAKSSPQSMVGETDRSVEVDQEPPLHMNNVSSLEPASPVAAVDGVNDRNYPYRPTKERVTIGEKSPDGQLEWSDPSTRRRQSGTGIARAAGSPRRRPFRQGKMFIRNPIFQRHRLRCSSLSRSKSGGILSISSTNDRHALNKELIDHGRTLNARLQQGLWQNLLLNDNDSTMEGVKLANVNNPTVSRVNSNKRDKANEVKTFLDGLQSELQAVEEEVEALSSNRATIVTSPRLSRTIHSDSSSRQFENEHQAFVTDSIPMAPHVRTANNILFGSATASPLSEQVLDSDEPKGTATPRLECVGSDSTASVRQRLLAIRAAKANLLQAQGSSGIPSVEPRYEDASPGIDSSVVAGDAVQNLISVLPLFQLQLPDDIEEDSEVPDDVTDQSFGFMPSSERRSEDELKSSSTSELMRRPQISLSSFKPTIDPSNLHVKVIGNGSVAPPPSHAIPVITSPLHVDTHFDSPALSRDETALLTEPKRTSHPLNVMANVRGSLSPSSPSAMLSNLIHNRHSPLIQHLSHTATTLVKRQRSRSTASVSPMPDLSRNSADPPGRARSMSRSASPLSAAISLSVLTATSFGSSTQNNSGRNIDPVDASMHSSAVGAPIISSISSWTRKRLSLLKKFGRSSANISMPLRSESASEFYDEESHTERMQSPSLASNKSKEKDIRFRIPPLSQGERSHSLHSPMKPPHFSPRKSLDAAVQSEKVSSPYEEMLAKSPDQEGVSDERVSPAKSRLKTKLKHSGEGAEMFPSQYSIGYSSNVDSEDTSIPSLTSHDLKVNNVRNISRRVSREYPSAINLKAAASVVPTMSTAAADSVAGYPLVALTGQQMGDRSDLNPDLEEDREEADRHGLVEAMKGEDGLIEEAVKATDLESNVIGREEDPMAVPDEQSFEPFDRRDEERIQLSIAEDSTGGEDNCSTITPSTHSRPDDPMKAVSPNKQMDKQTQSRTLLDKSNEDSLVVAMKKSSRSSPRVKPPPQPHIALRPATGLSAEKRIADHSNDWTPPPLFNTVYSAMRCRQEDPDLSDIACYFNPFFIAAKVVDKFHHPNHPHSSSHSNIPFHSYSQACAWLSHNKSANWLGLCHNVSWVETVLWSSFQIFGTQEGLLAKSIKMPQLSRLLKEAGFSKKLSSSELDKLFTKAVHQRTLTSQDAVVSPLLKNKGSSSSGHGGSFTSANYLLFKDIMKLISLRNSDTSNGVASKTVPGSQVPLSNSEKDLIDLSSIASKLKSLLMDKHLASYSSWERESKLCLSGVLLRTTYKRFLYDHQIKADSLSRQTSSGPFKENQEAERVRVVWERNLEQMRQIFGFYSISVEQSQVRHSQQGGIVSQSAEKINKPSGGSQWTGGGGGGGVCGSISLISFERCRDLVNDFEILPQLIDVSGFCKQFRSCKLFEWQMADNLLWERLHENEASSPTALDQNKSNIGIFPLHSHESSDPLVASPLSRDFNSSSISIISNANYPILTSDPYDLLGSRAHFHITFWSFLELLSRIAWYEAKLGSTLLEAVENLLHIMDASNGKGKLIKVSRRSIAVRHFVYS